MTFRYSDVLEFCDTHSHITPVVTDDGFDLFCDAGVDELV